MIGLAQIAAAAKAELGAMLLEKPLRVSCPQCGRFALRVLSVPSFAGARCERCRIDVVVLVSRELEVLSATER